jgi:hypothetical protein
MTRAVILLVPGQGLAAFTMINWQDNGVFYLVVHGDRRPLGVRVLHPVLARVHRPGLHPAPGGRRPRCHPECSGIDAEWQKLDGEQ